MADPVVGEALADEKHEDGALQESQPKEGDAIGDHQGAEVGDSKPVDAVIHAADSGGETHKEDTVSPSTFPCWVRMPSIGRSESIRPKV